LGQSGKGSVRTGGDVVVVISRGPERYDVPKLRGLTVEDAQIALAAANLQLGEQSRAYDDRVAEGKIISSSPEVGESVKRDTVVDVTVSRGPEPVTMPDLVGSNGDQAQERLTSLGLTVERSDEFSDSVASGLVISTDPSGGTTAYRGDTVQLVVSKGPPLVTVPNVVGRSEKDARDELKDAGFKVKVNKPLGFVIFGVNSQDPQGGTQAPRGSTVTITVV
jgi:serine/threonine-protein kinase